MKNTDIDRDGYSVDRFSDRHDISRSQTYVEINSGRLIASKVGNRTIITRENAERWRRNLPRFPIEERPGQVAQQRTKTSLHPRGGA
jgi:hypothetical protein